MVFFPDCIWMVLKVIAESTFCGDVWVLCDVCCVTSPPLWFKYDIWVAVEGREMLFAGVACVVEDIFYIAPNCIWI